MSLTRTDFSHPVIRNNITGSKKSCSRVVYFMFNRAAPVLDAPKALSTALSRSSAALTRRLRPSHACTNVAFMVKGRLTHSFLRQFVLLTLLLSSVLPSIQSVFACNLMGGKIQTVCCCKGPNAMQGCEMGGGCHANEAASSTGCCTATDVYQPLVDAVALPGLHASQLLAADFPQPPALFSSLLSHDLGIRFENTPYHYSPPPWGSGSNTYLITNRLRI